MKLLSLTLAALVLLTSLSAQATAAVDEAAAQKLSADIEREIRTLLKDFPEAKLEGSVTVQPDGDGFNVTLPAISAPLNSGELVRTGSMAARLTPLEGNDYRFSLTLPSPALTVFDLTQVPVAAVTMAGQDISGVWSEAMGTASRLNASLRGVQLTDPQAGKALAVIDQLKLSSTSNVTDGKLSGDTLFSLSAVRGFNKQQQELFSLSGMGLSYIIKGADFAAFKALQDQSSSLSAQSGGTKDVVDMLSQLARIGGESAFAMVARDVQVREIRTMAGSTQSSSWSLPLLRLAVDSASTSDGLTGGALRYRHEGLSVSPAPSIAVGELLPASLELSGRLERLPVSRLMAVLSEAAVPSKDPAAKPADPIKTALRELEAAGTTLKVDRLGYAAIRLTSGTSGTFTASAAAKWGAVGELNTRINGIDEVVARLSELLQPAADGKPQAQVDGTVQSALMGLSMLQGFGQIVPDAKPSARTYKLELGADGSLKLNGTDFGAMMGMAGGMAAGQPPQLAE